MNYSSKSAVIRSEVNNLNNNKIWRGIKIAVSLLIIIMIVALGVLLAVMLFTTLLDRKAIVNFFFDKLISYCTGHTLTTRDCCTASKYACTRKEEKVHSNYSMSSL